MAQVGRISGPLLQANLERNGIDLKFRNTLDNTPLLNFDASNGRIGINTGTVNEVDLHIDGTTRTTNLVGLEAQTPNFLINNNNINARFGDIQLNATDAIVSSAIETQQFYLDDNYISTKDSNANISLKPWQDYELDENDPYIAELIAGLLAASSGTSHAYKEFWEVNLPSGYQRGDLNESSSIDIDDVMGFLSVARQNSTSGGTYDRSIAAINAGLSTLEIFSDVNVDGNIHATGNITFEGNLTFGDAADDSTEIVDTVTIDADVDSNIIPDANETYNLGQNDKRWNNLHTELANIDSIYTTNITVGGLGYTRKQGNIFYVSVNGSDTAGGDSFLSPFKTIEHALSQVDPSTAGPVEVVIFPGDYQETLPLEVPANVTVSGLDMRNVIIRPATATQSEDVFLLNGESTVSNVTIKDFYYDSVNDKGYAFRFAPNATVTTRSPYVQNVSVITQGSATSASDPRGFASGDAGKGALVDGASVLNTSKDASMLFHSVTFITPGVDALTMTNGVKVEWLNSFTYFADKGLYAVNGSTGHLSTDGSTTLFGAEVRSIGSANVYGNKGAVADGADCLMYLIMHNFGYIGAGKLSSNVNADHIQANEVIELNSGQIRYSSTNQKGNFRVGDNFLVDFETGSTTLNISSSETESFAGLVIDSGTNKQTLVNGNIIEVGNFNIRDNNLLTVSGDVNINSSTNETNITSNVSVSDNVDITGNLSAGGNITVGDGVAGDTIDFNVGFDQNLNPGTTQIYSLGSPTKVWKHAHLGAANIGDIQINDNYITTDVTSANLELRASGTGIIQIPNSLIAEQDLTVNSTTTFVQDVTVYGTLSLIGDNEATPFRLDSFERLFRSNTNLENTRRRQFRVDNSGLRFALGHTTGNAPTYAIGDFIAIAEANTPDTYLAIVKILSLDSANTVNLNASNIIWNIEIIEGNLTSLVDRDEYIVKVSELNTFSDSFDLEGNLSVGQNLTVGLDGVFETISLKGNVITTDVSDSDIELRANATGRIYVPSADTLIENNLTVNGTTYTSDVNNTQQVEAVTFQNDTIQITGNSISSIVSDSDLDLTAAPNGIIDISNNPVKMSQDLTVNGVSNFITVTLNGDQTLVGNKNIANLPDIGSTGAQAYMQGVYGVNGLENFTFRRIRFGTTTEDVPEYNSSSEYEYLYFYLGTNVTLGFNTDYVKITNKIGQYIILDPTQATPPISGTQILNWKLVYASANYINFEGRSLVQASTTYLPEGYFNITGDVSAGSFDLDRNAQFENIEITGNLIHTTDTDVDLDLRAAGTGRVKVDSNLSVTQNVNIGTLIADVINITNDVDLNEIIIDGTIEFDDNIITTTDTDVNLELRANGAGIISIPSNDVNLLNDLQADTANIKNTSITGNIVHAGNLNRTGDTTVQGNVVLDGQVSLDRGLEFEEIKIENNYITTTTTNANLELRASGTGIVRFEDLQINKDINVGSLNDVQTINVQNTVALEVIELSSDVQLLDNVITTTESDSNLELRANGTGSVLFQDNLFINDNTIGTDTGALTFNLDTESVTMTSTDSMRLPTGTTTERIGSVAGLRFNTETNLFEIQGNTGNVNLGGLYSADSRTAITVSPHDDIQVFVNGYTEDSTSKVAEFTGNGPNLHGLQVDDILFNGNEIGTNVSNSNLDIVTDGTGSITVDSFVIKGNSLTLPIDTQFEFKTSGDDFRWVEFEGTGAIKWPAGNTASRPANPKLGTTRVNTDTGELETWIGDQWRTSAGEFASISEADMEEEAFVQTLIYG